MGNFISTPTPTKKRIMRSIQHIIFEVHENKRNLVFFAFIQCRPEDLEKNIIHDIDLHNSTRMTGERLLRENLIAVQTIGAMNTYILNKYYDNTEKGLKYNGSNNLKI